MSNLKGQGNDKEFKKRLRTLLGYKPGKLALYKQALTHRSAVPEDMDSSLESNERLEYIGDAILGSIVAGYLYDVFPDKSEGFLTKARSKIVNRENLNILAFEHEIHEILIVGTEISDKRTSVYGNALEALVGAMYLDKGYKRTDKFVRKIVEEQRRSKGILKHETNFKSRLIEWSQKEKRKVTFRLKSESGPEHNKIYTMEVRVDGEIKGTGKDYSKKRAEQAAAKKAVMDLGC